MTILDAMALVASGALGLMVYRFIMEKLGIHLPNEWVRGDPGTPWGMISTGLLLVSLGAPLAGPWLVTLPLLSFLAPRPPLRELARRPGLAASVGAVLGLTLAASRTGRDPACPPAYGSTAGEPGRRP